MQVREVFDNRLGSILTDRRWLWLLVVINFLGSIYGYYWYHVQLSANPVYWWIFIPDSPLSCTLFMLGLLLWLFRKRFGLLGIIGCLAVIKYGIWAVVINYTYWQITGNFTLENLMLSLSHLGMAVQGMVYLLGITIEGRQIIWAGIWLLAWDFMDYVVGLHPYLFDQRQYSIAQGWAVGLSVFLIGWLVLQRGTGPLYRIER